MSNVTLLSNNILKILSSKGWKELTPIQEKTIPFVLNTENDLIIEAGTASGKTEAVFLPILSELDKSKTHYNNLEVLYISPLRALINDQFERISKLSKDLGVNVTKWHSDVNYYNKKKFIENPNGILQITPESIESLFINHSDMLKDIVSNLKYIIIDEVHYFVGSDRGSQLQSLIYRIREIADGNIRVFALSATINNYDVIKYWVNPNTSKVVVVKDEDTANDYYLNVIAVETLNEDIINYLLNDIISLTENKKSLIFASSRNIVEFLTYNLNEVLGYTRYYAHHSFISKDSREELENKMRNGEELSIVCTNTLELGIDLGDLDLIVCFDGINSVSSLKQQIGRCGRRKNTKKICQIYCLNEKSLLLTMSAIDLLKQGVVEKSYLHSLNYNLVFQQTMSIVCENSSIPLMDLLVELSNNPAFIDITKEDLVELIKYMINQDYLSVLEGTELIVIGNKAEKLFKDREIYSMIPKQHLAEVYNEGKLIGFVEKLLNEGEIFNLNGDSWIVTKVSLNLYRLEVKYYKVQNYIKNKKNIAVSDEIILNVPYVLKKKLYFDFLNDTAKKILDNIYGNYCDEISSNLVIFVRKVNGKYKYSWYGPKKIINTIFFALKGCDTKSFIFLTNEIIPFIDCTIEEILSIAKKEVKKIKIEDFDEVKYDLKFNEVIPQSLLKKTWWNENFDIDGALKYLDEVKVVYCD